MPAQKRTLSEQIAPLVPCEEAEAWLKTQTGSAQKAWDACPRGDWMLWLINRFVTSGPWSDDRKPLLACCLDCAETVRHLRPKEQAKKINKAIEILRKWIGGTATVEEAKQAKKDLSDAYSANFAEFASAASDASASAEYAAKSASRSSLRAPFGDAASHSASDAAAACSAEHTDDAAAADARVKNQKQTADIVRQHYPKPPSFAWAMGVN